MRLPVPHRGGGTTSTLVALRTTIGGDKVTHDPAHASANAPAAIHEGEGHSRNQRVPLPPLAGRPTHRDDVKAGVPLTMMMMMMAAKTTTTGGAAEMPDRVRD